MKRMRLNARFFVSMGLVSLLASVMLLAMYLGYIPDHHATIRQGRAALAETIAVSTSTLISQSNVKSAEAVLEFTVNRNPDLESAAVVKADGETVAVIGDHLEKWQELQGGISTDAQIQVPILAAGKKWGRVELRFHALEQPGVMGFVREPRLQMVAFVMMGSMIAFYFYLGRVLRQLDPSRAIPGRVRAALDTLAEGLLVVDPKGYIVLANQAFSRVVGQAAEALIGKQASAFAWTGADGARFAADAYPWSATLRDGTPLRNGFARMDDSTGKARSFLVNCSAVQGGGKKPQGVLISFEDITELQEKEVELRQAKEDAEDANRAKSDFLANMSHEIRTPMTAILGYSEMLMDPGQTQESRRETVRQHDPRNGEHLLAIINDILDLSKIESARMSIEQIACDLPPSSPTWIALTAGRRSKELEFRSSWTARSRASPHRPARVQQVLVNLLGNAIKFTEKGGQIRESRCARAAAARVLRAIRVDVTGHRHRDDSAQLDRCSSRSRRRTTRRRGGSAARPGLDNQSTVRARAGWRHRGTQRDGQGQCVQRDARPGTAGRRAHARARGGHRRPG